MPEADIQKLAKLAAHSIQQELKKQMYSSTNELCPSDKSEPHVSNTKPSNIHLEAILPTDNRQPIRVFEKTGACDTRFLMRCELLLSILCVSEQLMAGAGASARQDVLDDLLQAASGVLKMNRRLLEERSLYQSMHERKPS